MPMKGATVAVQGFGNVGSVAARLLAARGAARSSRSATGSWRCTTPTESTSTTRSPACKTHRTLEGYPGGDVIDNDTLLTLDVDVLVPAALENVITTKNAARRSGPR